MRHNSIYLSLQLILLTTVLWRCQPDCDAGITDAKTADSILDIEVVSISLQSSTSQTLTRFGGKLIIEMRVTNRMDAEVTLEESQIRLRYGDKVAATRRRFTQPLLSEATAVGAKEQITGSVMFQVSAVSPKELPLAVEWQVNNVNHSVDLNQELRQLINMRTEYIGYEERIALIEIDRTIDLLTIWTLAGELRRLGSEGIARVVLAGYDREQRRLSDDVRRWLQLANRSMQSPRPRFWRGYPTPVQFAEFHVTGFQYGGRNGRFMHSSREHAVAAAAQSLYRRLTTEEAIAAMQSPEDGIRRAALTSCIDQLPDGQLREVVADAASASESNRQLVMELLDRVSTEVGVQTLESFLLSSLTISPLSGRAPTTETIVTAANTLVRCIHPDTERALLNVWSASQQSAQIRDTIVRQTMATQDYRWVTLVEEFAAAELERYVAPKEDQEDGVRQQRRAVNPLLPRALRFVHRNSTQFVNVARVYVTQINVQEVQDVLIEIVGRSLDVQDQAVAAQCITDRLKDGSLTTPLLRMIHQSPDPAWTKRLLELHHSPAGKRQQKATFVAAIACANDEQLNRIIDQYDALEQRFVLFQHLNAMAHPRVSELLRKELNGAPQDVVAVLRYLQAPLSTEMLQLIMDRYDQLRLTAEHDGKLDSNSLNVSEQLLTKLARFEHPETRRLLNLTMFSPVQRLRKRAQTLVWSNAEDRRKSGPEIDPWEARRAGDDTKAMKAVNQYIKWDPFDPDTRMLRASLHLRQGKIEAALQDIREADRLSPGDVFTESTLALANVRLSDIQQAVDQAEAVLAKIPANGGSYFPWTQYNTACVYGRALERSELSENQIANYTQRAIELLKLAIVVEDESGSVIITDYKHVENDPDLIVFHDHSEWSVIVGTIRANAEAEPKSEP